MQLTRIPHIVTMVLAFLLSLLVAPQLAVAKAHQSIVWTGGQVDHTGRPHGVLLSDNEGYWGPCVFTGVSYTYESNPNNPIDRIKNQKDTFGRRLLDGKINGNWYVPVGQSRGPMVIVFDFKRPCQFTEVTVMQSRSPNTAVKVEVRDTPKEPWRIAERAPQDKTTEAAKAGQKISRVRLKTPASGRYMRVSIEAKGITYIDEVLIWGTAEVSKQYPEHIAPTYRLDLPKDQWESIPGITTTRFNQSTFNAWRQSLGTQAKAPAVWALAEASTPTKPVLPDQASRASALVVNMARNETESRYVTLTNTSLDRPCVLNVQNVSWTLAGSSVPIATIQTEVRVGGALPTKTFKQRLTAQQRLRLMENKAFVEHESFTSNVQVLPFFAKGEQLGSNMMRRYLTNGSEIQAYPRLTLPPGGSAVFMIRTTTDHPVAGTYQAQLAATTDEGAQVVMPLKLQVANVVLPDPPLWVRSWGPGTREFPFETQQRRQRDVLVNRQLGVTVWKGFPTPGSKAELFGRLGRTYYRLPALPGKYVSAGYSGRMQPQDIKPKDRQAIVSHIQDLMKQAKALNLSHDQWWVELWDEPQEKNVAFFGALAKIIKETDPKIHIYMNPLFWRPGHAPPEVVFKDLSPFYNELVDISVPVSTLVRGPESVSTPLWTHTRFVNAMFIHPAARAGRRFSWRAFELGFNGWGYYCYYAPRGNPWDIRTWSQLNFRYQMVFPGPQGPIPMPIYETMRDGWEDYRLLTALREQGHHATLKRILQAQKDKVPLSKLHDQALEAWQK